MDQDPRVTGNMTHGSASNVVPMRPSLGRSEMGDLVGPFWTEGKTIEALGVESRDVLAGMRGARTLLGMEGADGDCFYPVIQFETRDGAVWVKPALIQFFTALRDRDPWTVGVLLHTPAPELDGLTPAIWVRQELDVDTLVDYARRLAHEWAH